MARRIVDLYRIESVSKSPSIDFSTRRRQMTLRPSCTSVCTNHAVLEVMRDSTTTSDSRPIDLTGLRSLLLVPARRTLFSNTSATSMLAGDTMSFFGVRRIFLPRGSAA